MPLEKTDETTETSTGTETVEETSEATETEETAEETTETEETTDEPEETTEEELKVSKEEYALLSLLKNPGTRKQALASIAESAGLKILAGEETKREAKKNINTALKESLGSEWEFLADRLGPAIEAAIDSKVGELRGEFHSAEEKQRLRDAEKATTRMYKVYPDFKMHEESVLKLMEKMTPAEGMSPFEFIESLYFVAKGRRGKGDLAKKTAARIAGNIREGQPSGGVSDASKLLKGSKRPSLTESIQAALTTLREKGTK